jgi:hypothetical protein
MKYILLFALALFGTGVSIAQSGSAKEVKWTFTSKKISENVYEVRMAANINGDYHMYAQQAGAEGPIPTTFKFTPNPLVTLDGKTKEEGKLVNKFESAWDGKVNYYEKKVEFVQVVKLKGKVKTNIAGKVEFIVCNESRCLPPAEVDFKIAVGG